MAKAGFCVWCLISDDCYVGSRPVCCRVGDAMRRLYPKLHHWRATTFDRSAALQAYIYLAEAHNADDLERRIHQVERRHHFRH